ncbi:hypothetical protein [Methylobacterium planeticum]|nr:hypothetical protein [Methylobacterium planeticum]
MKSESDGEPALAGKVKVSVDVNNATADKVVTSIQTYIGTITS